MSRPNDVENQNHLDNPSPADYWHEHFVAQVLVLAQLPNGNIVVTTDVKRDREGQLFLVEKAREITPQELAALVMYAPIGDKPSAGFVSDVVPKSNVGAVLVQQWKAEHQGKYQPWTPPPVDDGLSPQDRTVQTALKAPTLVAALLHVVEWEHLQAVDRLRKSNAHETYFTGLIHEVVERYGK